MQLRSTGQAGQKKARESTKHDRWARFLPIDSRHFSSHIDLRESRREKHVGEQAATCEKEKRTGKKRKTLAKRCPLARSIPKLLIHLILLGFVSASLAQGAAGWM